jgi:RNA polymerase sigma factor (sigma-70 family)
MALTRMDAAELLAAAQNGDEAAFARLVGPLRPGLYAHCYRLLGSLQDAEDALQEALLAAWQGLARFENKSLLRTWLFTIATHSSLRLATRRPRRVVASEVMPAADPSAPHPDALDLPWLEPFPDSALDAAPDELPPDAVYEVLESVELAFVAALQHLPGTQRAVLILRDVLGFSAEEAATALETSVASVTSALQRARATLARHAPARTQQATRQALGEQGHQRLAAGGRRHGRRPARRRRDLYDAALADLVPRARSNSHLHGRKGVPTSLALLAMSSQRAADRGGVSVERRQRDVRALGAQRAQLPGRTRSRGFGISRSGAAGSLRVASSVAGGRLRLSRKPSRRSGS